MKNWYGRAEMYLVNIVGLEVENRSLKLSDIISQRITPRNQRQNLPLTDYRQPED
jgi:hypothetical protein